MVCPFLDADKLECHATHAQGGVGVGKPQYPKLNSAEVEKCKTIWKKCPYYIAFS